MTKADLVTRLYNLELTAKDEIQREAMAREVMELVLAAAEMEIDAVESPAWTISKGDTEEQKEAKEKMRQFEIAVKAIEIAETRIQVGELVQIYLLEEIRKRKLYHYPANGSWTDMAALVRELIPPGRSGSVISTLGFLARCETLDEMGLPGVDRVAAIATEKTFMLGHMQLAANKIPDSISAEEKAERLLDIISDAETHSIRDFDKIYNPSRIPPAGMEVIEDGDRLYLVILASPTQYEMITRRLGDMVEHREGLIRPLTPGDIYGLLQLLLNETASGPVMEKAFSLLKKAVLAQPNHYKVYGVAKAADGDCITFEEIQRARLGMTPPQIREVLADLCYYGLLKEYENNEGTMWSI